MVEISASSGLRKSNARSGGQPLYLLSYLDSYAKIIIRPGEGETLVFLVYIFFQPTKWMDDLQFYVFFNITSVISEQWEGDVVKLCAPAGLDLGLLMDQQTSARPTGLLSVCTDMRAQVMYLLT